MTDIKFEQKKMPFSYMPIWNKNIYIEILPLKTLKEVKILLIVFNKEIFKYAFKLVGAVLYYIITHYYLIFLQNLHGMI